MSQSIRYVVRGARGRVPLNFNWPAAIRSNQAVVSITAAEIKPAGTPSMVLGGAAQQDFVYHLGAADIWVTNVCPHHERYRGEPGGVEFILHVNWGSPLDVAVTITVEDQPPVEIQN